ncbi:beta-lactamase family protein [Microbacterium lacus]|uniref:serine hydrolase domain-containing protein n=1 Tax=Microbacterium lacus TaxID=415217 RepID=UPI00384F47F4
MRVPRTTRRVGALIAGALTVVLALSACSADTEVTLDLPAQAEGAFPEATQTQLQDAVTHAMTAAGASGAIVGVWAPWSGSWVAGQGTQDVGAGAPVTADMQFRAGRITRSMTCDILYEFVEQGRVSLDDSVSDYVSGVADLTDVTLGQLCDSTSGIGSFSPQLAPLWTANPTRVWNPRELASYGLGVDRTAEPGLTFSDSDAGYVLLGLALERIGGMSAAELFQQYISEPLGLEATVLPGDAAAAPGEGPVLEGRVTKLGENGAMNCLEPVDVTEISASIGYTNSGVVSTVTDLGRYAQALATEALRAEETDRFKEAKPAYPGAPSWFNAAGGALLAGSLVGNSGVVPGYASATFADSGTGLTVVVVLNNSTPGPDIANALAWELAALASKAPAAAGETVPTAGLPWTAEQYHAYIASIAICPLPEPAPVP